MKLIRHTTAAWLAAAALFCGGQAPAATATPDLQRYAEEWDRYVAELAGQDLQDGCRPRRYTPPDGIPRRGAVLALHGFSACPQQFFQLGPALAARGFEVLVPLLPGHGWLPAPPAEEDLSGVPTAATWALDYGGLVVRMNRIMEFSPGERVLIGYSLGGTLALNAAYREPGLYERMLLVAPLVAIRGGALVESGASLLGRLPGIRDWIVKTAGYREKCDGWATGGRGGFCDYRFKHVPPLVELKRQNRRWHQEQPLVLPMQVIVADDDTVISNDAIMDMVEAQRSRGPVEVCLLTGGVPHEILTPFENVGREMHWLDKFLAVATDFAAEGRPSDCND